MGDGEGGAVGLSESAAVLVDGGPGAEHPRQRVIGLRPFRRAGVLPATYEVIYGHAWKTAPRRTEDGRQVIQFSRGKV